VDAFRNESNLFVIHLDLSQQSGFVVGQPPSLQNYLLWLNYSIHQIVALPQLFY